MCHAKKTILTLTRSETEIKNICSNWRDKPYFNHSTENEGITIFPASHFLKILCLHTFTRSIIDFNDVRELLRLLATFANRPKLTHDPNFAKEPNFPCSTHNDCQFISHYLRYSCKLEANNLTAMNQIKEVLADKGLKQTWLAEKLGKSYNMVNSYVQNRQQPRLEVLTNIAAILDVDIKELIVSTKK